jgi:hypothetical protein
MLANTTVRNEDADRSTTTALRKSCAKGKRRNPKTKRCRKVCVKGQHRNTRTKRCRNTCKMGTRRSRKTRRCITIKTAIA